MVGVTERRSLRDFRLDDSRKGEVRPDVEEDAGQAGDEPHCGRFHQVDRQRKRMEGPETLAKAAKARSKGQISRATLYTRQAPKRFCLLHASSSLPRLDLGRDTYSVCKPDAPVFRA